MLTVGMASSGPQIVMQSTTPMVYLDHWAMRLFAGDQLLARRLSIALDDTRGCLALSWLHFSEYAEVDDAGRQQIEEFLETLLPNLFCLEVSIFAVIPREARGEPVPYGDAALAQALVFRRQSTVRPFTTTGLFNGVHQLASARSRLVDPVLERLCGLQREHLSDLEFRRSTRAAGPLQVTDPILGTTPALALVRALIAVLIEDGCAQIRANDIPDLFHATVPIVSCDAVLLDGAWEDRVGRARTRLAAVNPAIKLASCFSRRRDGVERFLELLEAGVA